MPLAIYCYDKITGWKYVRTVSKNEASRWLTIWRRDAPDTTFVVAAKRPSRPPKQTLTAPSYLDRLGYESAGAGADAVRRRIAREGGNVALPLSDADVNHLLDTTVEELTTMKKLNWRHTNTDRRHVFVNAWYETMQKLGIAN